MEAKMPEVRGFAVEVRPIGLTSLFDTHGFSLNTLTKVTQIDDKSPSGSTACRYPCNNCRVLLSSLRIQAGSAGQEYDTDIDAANVAPH